MITGKDLYYVFSAVVPLYVTMFLAYASVKWWKIFSQDQCAGINQFVALFAVPVLSFDIISRVNPYKMDFLFIIADTLAKVVVLLALLLWSGFCKGNLDWVITLFSLFTFPNTLIVGIPLTGAMYGDDKESLLIQVVVLQCLVWLSVLIFMYEYRAARILIMQSATEKSLTEGEEQVLQVIVTRPAAHSGSSDYELETIQNSNKVVSASPAFAEIKPEEETGGVCRQSLDVCIKEEEKVAEKMQKNENSEKALISSKKLMLIMKIVFNKLIKNPNIYASILGLIWALASSRWDFKKPKMMENSVRMLSNAGLGMAMFSVGLFMALQPKIIACGTRLLAVTMVGRFIVGPGVMAIASAAVGLRGTILSFAIIQAGLPQALLSFVFAREYNIHPELQSTAVTFGMIVSLPVLILYYILLGL